MTDTPPVVPAKIGTGGDLGPACEQCGGMMQRTGSCYTCSSLRQQHRLRLIRGLRGRLSASSAGSRGWPRFTRLRP